jgi:hypothetical protein
LVLSASDQLVPVISGHSHSGDPMNNPAILFVTFPEDSFAHDWRHSTIEYNHTHTNSGSKVYVKP